MPKYLFYGAYTPEGYKGLVQEGGSKRIEAAKQAFVTLAGNVSGTFSIKGVPLLTAAEMDEAVNKSVDFRPPGH